MMDRENACMMSVVVPCYNEEAVILRTHERLLRVVKKCVGTGFELLYVNDGSTDRTEAILHELSEQDERVIVLSFTRNFGHQPAVTAGLEHALGDIVVVIDADLQDPPELIPDMLSKWRQGYEIVYGVRTKRKEGFMRRLIYAVFYRAYRMVANIDVPLDSGDFALLDRRVVDVLNDLPEKNRFVRGLRAWAGFKQVGCAYERAARAAGKSKYTFATLVQLAFDGIFNFSTLPLTMIFLVGICTAAFSATAAAVYFLARIMGFTIFGRSPEDVPGFTTLILTLLLFSGVQLMSMGVIGEYLARIYQEAKRRPAYLIRQIQNGASRKLGRRQEKSRIAFSTPVLGSEAKGFEEVRNAR